MGLSKGILVAIVAQILYGVIVESGKLKENFDYDADTERQSCSTKEIVRNFKFV